MADESLRDLLRSLPVFGDDVPDFDPAAAPDDPLELLVEWLHRAIEAGVSQPHAMVLATADPDGQPSARTLLLKDVTLPTPDESGGVWFATLSDSPKGRDLAANPRAALLLYWREQGRQVRISGAVAHGDRDVSDRDFLARHPAARATVLAGRQSEPMPSGEELEREMASAREFVAVNPNFVPETWHSYVLTPASVEFWQSAPRREQRRLRYTATPERGWQRDMLWP